MVTPEEQYDLMMSDRLLRFHSYLFWTQMFAGVQGDSEYVQIWRTRDERRYWNMLYKQGKDYCTLCNGFKMVVPENNNRPTTVGEFNIYKVICFCETLKMLNSIKRHSFESSIDPRVSLDGIRLIDVPKGAAKETQIILTNVRNWLQKPTKWMLLTGGTGTAKTHILFALRKALGEFGYYITASDLVQKLGQGVADGNTGEIIHELIHAPFLLIDDFGMEHKKNTGESYGINIITHICDQRYILRERAPVVIATNLELDSFSMSNNENIVRLGSRFMDSELSIINVFTQADYRPLTTKQRAGLK